MMKASLLFWALCLTVLFVNIGFLNAQVGTKITQTTLVETKVNYVLHNKCFGDKKGAINVMVSGGIPPYKYQWSNGATTQDITGLAAGIYILRVIDSNNCPDSLTVEIKQPPKIELKVNSVTDILCFGFKNGAIDVSVDGGVPPYVYSWSNGSTVQNLKNVEAGEYALLVTDANHCQEIISAVVQQNALIVRSDEKKQNVECAGDSTGIIDIQVKGGVPPYKYRWTSGETSEDIKNLKAGTYTVMVTDIKGCSEAYSTAIVEPQPINIEIEEVRHIKCADDKSGAININVTGGVPPYIYNWNQGLSAAQDLAGINAGKYHLIIKDSRNCKRELQQEVVEPPKLVVAIENVKHVLNYGGTDGAIYIDVKGGKEPYKFEWSNGAKSKNVANIPANNYTCRVTDANNCVNMLSVNIEQPALLDVIVETVENNKCFNDKKGYINIKTQGGVQPYKYLWSNGETTEDIKNLAAGTYSLVVTDANGISKTVKATIEQPEKLVSAVQSVTNIQCFGRNEGIVDINVNGGTPPYTYNWNNGAKTQDITKVPAGQYSVQIIDKNLCIDSLKATITQNPLLEVSPESVTDIKCYGRAEGAVNINVSGGVAPYVYKWNNGAITRNLTNLKAGDYNLNVTDSRGCSKTLDVIIKEPSLMVSGISSVTDVKCKGDATGAVIINVNGGTPPYSYIWNDGKTEKDNRMVKAGSYNVKITDALGCVNNLSATINEPAKLQSILDKIENIDCYGDKTGAVYVSVAGGVPPYNYKWSNNATTQNIIGVGVGDYTLNVTDQNNCISELKATIVQNKEMFSSVQTVTNVNCFGLKTGAAQISVSGGVEPYKFKWSNGAVTKDLTNVGAGSYKLNITDAKGCLQSVNLSITEPPQFKGEITSTKQIGCFGDANGEIVTTFKGGVAPYSFEWSNKEVTKDIKGLPAGVYTLTAKDKNGCIEKLVTTLVQPTKLEVKLISVKNNLCNGEKNGAIDISVEGGVKPYTYNWTNGESSQDLLNLKAGKYGVKVQTATGCISELNAEITEPQPLEIKIASTTDINCFGGNNGAVTLSVTGGKAPYIFSWSNGAITQDIKNIVAGSYTVNVTDANGCFNQTSAIIKQPEPLVAKFVDIKNISCFGDSTGAINLEVLGGTQPYSYKWSNGATVKDISGLKVGTFSVEIKDAKGCTQLLTTKITQPDLLVSKIVSATNVLCNGLKEGSIDISVSGGVTPYVYSWSNGSKEQDLSNIGAGVYSVNISDANGCKRQLSAEIKEPPLLSVSVAEVLHNLEFGNKKGSINIDVKGGNGPYKYSWSNGAITPNINNLEAGNYSLIVGDANGCRKDLTIAINQPDAIEIIADSVKHIKCFGENTGYVKLLVKGGVSPYKYSWSNGETSNILRNISAGSYQITITDANGAIKEKVFDITQPGQFKLKIDTVNNPTCYELNNGAIKTDIQGGTTPYTFAWSNGATTQDLKGLTSGKYLLKVTDAEGCLLKDSVELTKPSPLEVALVNTNHVLCNGQATGSVNISVSGGVSPYKYSWDHGSTEQNLANITSGNYTVKVFDANRCSKSISTTVNEPPALVTRLESVNNVPCNGQKNGSIITSVTGGTPPYNYKWSNGANTANISALDIGNYNVEISDKNGCTSKLTANITEPEKLVGTVLNTKDINCNGDKEGVINIDIKGGTIPYVYDWSNGSKSKNQTNIPAGDYSVKVIDAKGCEILLNAKVNEPPKLQATLANVQNVKCFGDNTGIIDVNVIGGVEPYQYTWSNGAIIQDLIKIKAGNYSLTIRDLKGCIATISAIVEEPALLTVNTTAINNVKCNGNQTGEITVAVNGGKEPYKYLWSNGIATRDIQNVKAGAYKLTVSDANNCEYVYTASITEPPILHKSIDFIKHINCNGESNGSVDISVSGGTVPYSYQWSNGVTTQDLLNVPAGSYSVLIKEGNGCEAKLEMIINEPTPFISDLVSVDHNNCFGDKNGSVKISVDGGTLPYTFKWNNGAKSQNLENIVAGDYAVLVSDANGCNKTIKASVTEPSKLILIIDSARNVKCCGDTSGAIFISIYGGVPPYKYLWSHGKTTQDVTGLAEGTYTVTVTDAKNCIVTTPEEGNTIYEKIIAQGRFVTRDILFDVGKATIKEQSFIEISRIASFMKEHMQVRFSIEGHTDSQGDDAFNMKLSQQRADAIKESLIKFGISENRLETKGYGETKPIDTNNTPEGRANNRRVEFIPL